MDRRLSRRMFLNVAGGAAAVSLSSNILGSNIAEALTLGVTKDSFAPSGRIVDMHVHYRDYEPKFIDNLLVVADRLNLAACLLIPFAHRQIAVDAAKQYPNRIIPFGSIKLDDPDVVQQVRELHSLGFRGLGEISSMKKNCSDPTYFPVYDLANQYKWILMFHTGIVGRSKFDEPENIASGRMRPIYLEEISRQFPKISILGAHLGNPEYEWAAEVSRWNPNVYFDLSGTTLPKMHERLGDFRKIFWWKDVEWEAQPSDDPSPFSKLVFGSDCSTPNIEAVVNQYHALFEACDVPEHTRKMIMGGTMEKLLSLAA